MYLYVYIYTYIYIYIIYGSRCDRDLPMCRVVLPLRTLKHSRVLVHSLLEIEQTLTRFLEKLASYANDRTVLVAHFDSERQQMTSIGRFCFTLRLRPDAQHRIREVLDLCHVLLFLTCQVAVIIEHFIFQTTDVHSMPTFGASNRLEDVTV